MTAAAPHPNRRDRAALPPELRRAPVTGAARAWIHAATGAPVTAVNRLPGASSSAVHRVTLGDGRTLVLRRYVWPWFLQAEPDGPARETAALGFAHRHGLPAPEVVAADPHGTVIGDGVPAVVMTFLPGRPHVPTDLTPLAELAAAVHDVSGDGFGYAYFPWRGSEPARPPRRSRQPALWEAALDHWRAGPPRYRPTLVHRDFHPGNVLWSRERVSGIVDWVNACTGPWGCDVAHCRDNLVQLAGFNAADRFLEIYLAITGRTYDPYWELASVLEHDVSDWSGSRLADAEHRLERALRAL